MYRVIHHFVLALLNWFPETGATLGPLFQPV